MPSKPPLGAPFVLLLLVALLLGIAPAAPAAAQPVDLLISEYVEGSSLNKAVELYNGTGAAIDLGLGGYRLEIYFNGSTTPGTDVALTGVVAAGDVFVVADDGAVAAVLAEADQTPSNNFFNGDDAVVIRRGATVVDSIGQVGFDPGSEWGSGDTSTQNNTLRRKASACTADADPGDPFDPAVGYDGFPQDTFDGLGAHAAACGGGGPAGPQRLLLTELVVTPTAGEYVEIHNPNPAAVDLSDVYLTDATFAPGGTFYYNVVTGTDAGGGGFGDFHARFPDGASIAPGEYQTVALAGSDGFLATYGVAPTYELYEDGAAPDAVPDMREALPGSINGQGGLTNSGEVAILYHWDGASDLVTDLDYALWGDGFEAVDKTGVSIDGPDAGSGTSTYQPDTAVSLQDVIAPGGHPFGGSFERIDLAEGAEVQAGGNGAGGADETSEDLSNTWAVGAAPTPGAPAPPPGLPVLEIHEVQGVGFTSPFAGQDVRLEGDVVTALRPDGFFVQTPDAAVDADPETSQGLFVFTGGAPPVVAGDEVSIEGRVVEFFDFTEISFPDQVTITSTGLPLPAPVSFDDATPSPDQPRPATEYERYESMLVSVPVGVVSGPNQRFGSDPLAEVHVAAGTDRPLREEGIEYPGLPGLPVWDGNPEIFELDPDRMGLPNLAIFAGSTFSATGVLGFEFGGYELWPTELTVDPAGLPVPVPAAGELELTAGSLNLFRLFDDADDPGSEDDGQVVSTAEYQLRLGKFSAYVRDVLGALDVLAVQEAESLAALDDLAARIATDDPTVLYTAYLVEGNDVGGIDVGYLVREDRFRVDAVTQLAEDEILTFDGSLLHDRPPLLLEGAFVADGAELPASFLVVHMRSLGGIDDSQDGPRVRQKRLEQAQSVAAIVQDLQTTDPDVRLAVLGDFNAFEFTDGYVDVVGQVAGDFDPADNLLSGADLVDPDLTVLTESLPAEERYSFVFRGSGQALDHALVSTGLTDLVTGYAYGRGNADAPLLLADDGSTPLRSSDHDGLVVAITADPDGDGVPIGRDLCPGTEIPESVPTAGLLPNHFALVDGDLVFDTVATGRGGGGAGFTLDDTAGCSCEQIIAAAGLGQGHVLHGCSRGELEEWVEAVGE